MKKKSITFGVIFTLAVSALLFFVDVVPVSRLRRATPSNAEKTNPALLSTYYLCIRITNKIFTESLKNENSEDYMQLKKQVEQMLYVVYNPLSYGKYEGIINMIFSNGSVIANSTLMFRSTNYINSNLIKSIFTTNIQNYPSKTIDRDVTFPEGQLPLQATLLQVAPLTAIITSTPPHNPAVLAIANRRPRQANTPNETNLSDNITKFESHNIPSTTTTSEQNNRMEGSTTPSVHDNAKMTSASSPGETTKTTKILTTTRSPGETTNTTKILTTTRSPGETTNTTKILTTTTSPGETTNTTKILTTTRSPGETTNTTKILTTTRSPGETTNTTKTLTTTSSPGETTNTTKILTTTRSPGETTNTTKILTTTRSPGETTNTTKILTTTRGPGETTNTTKTLTTIRSPVETTNTAKTLTTNRSPEETTNTTKTLTTTGSPIAIAGGREEVPGWGIALLVLAALILLLLLVLITLLLVWWCCGRRNRGYSPYDQIHGGLIPMHSTHSRFDMPNSIPYEEMEVSSKNRTGTYMVNK